LGRITEKDKKGLQQLVRDCEVIGLNEQESLEYIQKRFGKEISRSSYYNIKSNLKKNEEEIFKNRLDHHTKIKFVKDHFTRIDELEIVQKGLIKILHEEVSKPIDKRNLTGISKIASNINSNITTLTVLSSGSPLFEFLIERKVTEVKSFIKYGSDSIPLSDLNNVSMTEKEHNKTDNPPSSLLLPDTDTYEEDKDNDDEKKKLDSERIF
jgi:hypothetical protein